MTAALLATIAVVVCASLVSAGPPGIYMSGSDPSKISEYWAPKDQGGCSATTAAFHAGSFMPQYVGTAAVTVTVPGVTGTYGFFAGGYDSTEQAYKATTSTYSIAQGVSEQGSLMTVPRAYHAITVLKQQGMKQQILVCGGKTNGGVALATCEMTVFCTGTSCPFKTIKQLPQGSLYGHTMISLASQQRVFVFGGTTGSGQLNPLVYEYDVTGDSWLTKSPQGGIWNGLTGAATFTVQGDTAAITCGGKIGNVVQNACYKYDSEANLFIAWGKLRIRRYDFSIVPFTQNGRSIEYFAIGGSDGVEPTAEVEVSTNGMNWAFHCGSLFNAMQSAATVSLTV